MYSRYDSDNPRVHGDVGMAGVAVDSVEDMKVKCEKGVINQLCHKHRTKKFEARQDSDFLSYACDIAEYNLFDFFTKEEIHRLFLLWSSVL